MKVPNQYRVRGDLMGSNESYGNNGYFIIPFENFSLSIIASDGEGWDHVSISLPNRCPNWREMQFIKDLFFNEEETVIQFHPKKSEYVNNHPNCLHLWKPQDFDLVLPPSILTGIKELERTG